MRSLVGMDEATAKQAFSNFLEDNSLTAPQMRFVEMVIEQLTVRGVIDAKSLYELPFTNLHSEGPEGVFYGNEAVLNKLFDQVSEFDRSEMPSNTSAGEVCNLVFNNMILNEFNAVFF